MKNRYQQNAFSGSHGLPRVYRSRDQGGISEDAGWTVWVLPGRAWNDQHQFRVFFFVGGASAGFDDMILINGTLALTRKLLLILHFTVFVE